MVNHRRINEGEEIARVQGVVGQSPVYIVETKFVLHRSYTGRASDFRCPCCNSKHSEAYDERPDQRILIDRSDGYRKAYDDANDKAGWLDVASRATPATVLLRCTEESLEAIVDEHRIVGLTGGFRFGKTHLGVTRMARKWALRGGRRRLFWFVAPSRDQCFIALEKLILGEDDSGTPPVLPLDQETLQPILATKWPEKQQSYHQVIHMIDGSRIVLMPAYRKGHNLRGRKVVDILVDELTAIGSVENWHAIVGRTTDTVGSVTWCAQPPDDISHWANDELVKPCTTHEELRPTDRTLFTFPTLENVWLDHEEAAKQRANCRDDLQRRRDWDGEWIGAKGNLWVHWDSSKHVRLTGDSYDARDIGYEVITGQAIRVFFRGRNPYTKAPTPESPDYVGGQDFNSTVPMSCLVAQIVGDKDDPSTWAVLVQDEVIKRRTESGQFSKWLAEDRAGNTRSKLPCWPGIPIVCDSSGAHFSTAHLRAGSRSAACDAKNMSVAGFDCRPCRYNENGNPENPTRRDSVSLCHKLMAEGRILVADRCRELIHALETQQDAGDGTAFKIPGRKSDELSGPIDALRYLVWALFSYEVQRKGRFLG